VGRESGGGYISDINLTHEEPSFEGGEGSCSGRITRVRKGIKRVRNSSWEEVGKWEVFTN